MSLYTPRDQLDARCSEVSTQKIMSEVGEVVIDTLRSITQGLGRHHMACDPDAPIVWTGDRAALTDHDHPTLGDGRAVR